MTYYKAVRPNGRDFWSNTVQWIPEDGVIPDGGWLVKHRIRQSSSTAEAKYYLSVSTKATDCTGASWPCRLLKVVGIEGEDIWTPNPYALPNKRAASSWRVVEELPAWMVFGPYGQEVLGILDTLKQLPAGELRRLQPTGIDLNWLWDTVCSPVWDNAIATARNLWASAWTDSVARTQADWLACQRGLDAGWEAIVACLMKDNLEPELFAELTDSWFSVVGAEKRKDA